MDPNPQTPFVLSPRSRSEERRTTFVVDLRSEDPDRSPSEDAERAGAADNEDLVEERDG